MSPTLHTNKSRPRPFVPVIVTMCAALFAMLVLPISAAIPIATVAIIAGCIVVLLIGMKKG